MTNDKHRQLTKQRISEHLDVINQLLLDESFLGKLGDIIDVLIRLFKTGGKLLLCGNGGSAADAQHIATELVSKFLLERNALDAEALTVNTSTITAISNDDNFDNIFARQIEAKGKREDVLLAITTSGNSKNIVEAIEVAKNLGMVTVGLTGTGKRRVTLIEERCDHCICVPSSSTPRIQEAHILIGHIICESIEKELFG